MGCPCPSRDNLSIPIGSWHRRTERSSPRRARRRIGLSAPAQLSSVPVVGCRRPKLSSFGSSLGPGIAVPPARCMLVGAETVTENEAADIDVTAELIPAQVIAELEAR